MIAESVSRNRRPFAFQKRETNAACCRDRRREKISPLKKEREEKGLTNR
jgi:hypothetical protein